MTLFPKLETRLRRHLHSKASPLSSSSSSLLSNAQMADQLELIRDDEVLAATIESLRIVEDGLIIEDDPNFNENGSESHIKVFLYKYPQDQEVVESNTTTGSRNLNIDDTSLTSDTNSFYSLETFPNQSSQGLWESLQFDSSIKASILAYLTAIFRFSLLGLTEKNEISFNRILLLHGPPGTGTNTIWMLTNVYCYR